MNMAEEAGNWCVHIGVGIISKDLLNRCICTYYMLQAKYSWDLLLYGAYFLIKMIRKMLDSDGQRVLEIYTQGIETRNATFETEAADWN
jgi:hypothetical protein